MKDAMAYTQTTEDLKFRLIDVTGANSNLEEKIKRMKLDTERLRGLEIQALENSNRSLHLIEQIDMLEVKLAEVKSLNIRPNSQTSTYKSLLDKLGKEQSERVQQLIERQREMAEKKDQELFAVTDQQLDVRFANLEVC